MKNHAFAAFLGSLLFIGFSAGAAPQGSSISPMPSNPVESSEPVKYQGKISLSQESYVSPDYKGTERKNFQFIGVGVDSLTDSRGENDIKDGLHTQIDSNIAPGANALSYLNVSQLYLKQNALIFGRKKLVWSELDESFDLGMFQPRFNRNLFQPESQGLTGLFLKVETGNEALPGGVYLFASQLFIPDQGAGYEIRDGQFENSSPFFATPPTQAQVSGQTDKILYNIQKPATEDILFNRSFAAKAFLGEETQGAFVQAAYANKPANLLSLGFQGALTSNNALAVDILPSIYNHRLLSGDLQYSFIPELALGVSALSESMDEPKYSAEWTYRTYSPSQMVSPFMKLRLKGFKAKLAYLKITGADHTDVGPKANMAEEVQAARYAFTNAYLAEMSYRYRIRRYQGLTFSTKYLTSEKADFDIWTASASYQWEERWSAYFDMQLASVQSKSMDGKKIAYYDYMNNDTATIGLRHVF